MSDVEKQHIIKAFRFEVGKVRSKSVQQQVVDMFANVDLTLAEEIALGVGVTPPKAKACDEASGTTMAGGAETKASPALSQLRTAMSPATRKVAVLAADGFDADEMKAVLAAFAEAKVVPEVVSENLGMIAGTDGSFY